MTSPAPSTRTKPSRRSTLTGVIVGLVALAAVATPALVFSRSGGTADGQTAGAGLGVTLAPGGPAAAAVGYVSSDLDSTSINDAVYPTTLGGQGGLTVAPTAHPSAPPTAAGSAGTGASEGAPNPAAASPTAPATAPDAATSPEPDVTAASAAPTPTHVPAAYNLAAAGEVTPVKTQLDGTCAVFAVAASAESNLMRQGVAAPDLSEFHLYNAVYNDDSVYTPTPYKQGMSFLMVAQALSKGYGAQTEKEFPFPKTGVQMSMDAVDSSAYHLRAAYHLPDPHDSRGELSPGNMAVIKNMIAGQGAVAAAFYRDGCDETYTNCYSPASSEADSMHHAVALVGWDDAYPATKFAGSQPPGDGAWLAKNSWGTDLGQDGYLWISYDDPTLGDLWSFQMAQNASDYDQAYFLDDVTLRQYSRIGGGYSAAEVFTNSGDHAQSLNRVSITTNDPALDYTVSVYQGPFPNGPTSGTALVVGDGGATTATGRFDFAGVQSVPLKPVTVAAGAPFAVVVQLQATTPGAAVQVLREYRVSPKDHLTSAPGQSYLMGSDGVWTDLKTASGSGPWGDLSIKAYATDLLQRTPARAQVAALADPTGAIDAFTIDSAGGLRMNQRSTAGSWATDWSLTHNGDGLLNPGAPVAVAKGADGRLMVFAVDSHGKVESRQQKGTTADAGWTDWAAQSDGGGFLPGSTIGVGQRSSGLLDLYLIGQDGAVHSRSQQPGGGWAAWQVVSEPGLFVPGTPVASGRSATGRLLNAAIGADGRLVSRTQTASDGQWSDWQAEDGPKLPSGAPLTLSAGSSGRLAMFVVDVAGVLQERRQATDGTWGPWTADGSAVRFAPGTTVAVAPNADGRLVMLAASVSTEAPPPGQESEGAPIVERHQTAPDGDWTTWAPVGTVKFLSAGVVALTPASDGRLIALAAGIDQEIWYATPDQAGEKWSDWSTLPGGIEVPAKEKVDYPTSHIWM